MTSGEPRRLGARRPRGARAVSLAALSVLVAACAAPPPSDPLASSAPGSAPASTASLSPDSSSGPAGLPDLNAILDPALKPIDLTVTPQAGATVSALIPATGGQMTTTGADGTVYTLTVPNDALLVDTIISMTPVASIQGLPRSGEQTHAIQLGPDGLHLEDFATLTIAPTTDLPVDEQIPFGYEGARAAMFLAFPVLKSPAIKLQLLHFSGYGVTKGVLASLDEVTRRFGGDAEARLSSLIVARMAAEGALERAGHEVPLDYWNGLEALLEELDVVSKVKATVKISLDTDTLEIKGDTALINTAIDIRQTVKSDCTVKGIRGGSVFKVTNLSFDATPDISPKPATLTAPGQPGVPGMLKDIVLKYMPTESTDNGTITCPQTPTQLLAGRGGRPSIWAPTGRNDPSSTAHTWLKSGRSTIGGRSSPRRTGTTSSQPPD